MKELLLALNEKPIAYFKAYRRICGSTTAGILLSQLMYWYQAVNGREFYKTDAEIKEETLLTDAELKTAKKKLKKLKVVTVTLRGVPAKTHYKVNEEVLIKLLIDSSLVKSTKLDQSNQPNSDGEINQTITENTTDTTLDKPDLQSVADEKEEIPYGKIVKHLNEKAGTSYRLSTKKTRDKIRARWNEGFRLNDFEKVIDDRVRRWKDTDQEQYLRPETLFGNKFEGYLNAYTPPTDLNNPTHLMDFDMSENQTHQYLEYLQHMKDKMPKVFNSVQILKASEYFAIRQGGSRWEALIVAFTPREIKALVQDAHKEAADKIRKNWDCPNIIELVNQKIRAQRYA